MSAPDPVAPPRTGQFIQCEFRRGSPVKGVQPLACSHGATWYVNGVPMCFPHRKHTESQARKAGAAAPEVAPIFRRRET